MTSALCKNCDTTLQGKYCQNCGQSASTDRFSWHEIWHHATHALTHVDTGIFFTLLELLRRPGLTIRNYLAGKRRAYFNPFTLLLTCTAICSLLYVHFGVETQLEGIKLNSFEDSSPTIVHKYFAIRSVFLILISSLADRFLLRYGNYNLPEMVISNTYQFGLVAALQVVCIPLFIWSDHVGWGDLVRSLFILGVLGYLFWTRWQLLDAGRKPARIAWIIVVLATELAIMASTGHWAVKPILMTRDH
jgi:Protein of unknown function (DUF3667)